MRHPNASTLGWLLARIDADARDDAVGGWLIRHATDPVEDSDVLVGLAVDGKSVRGSRTETARSTCWLPPGTSRRPSSPSVR